jgi:SH3 domain protein
MNWLVAIIGCVLLMQVPGAKAQSYYVDDHLQVGLHTQPALSSTIAELLPSGTELQLIERAGALARVRTSAGVEGWVDGNYITEEQPARVRVQAMEAELAGTQAALADLQAKLVVMEQQPQQATSGQPVTLPPESLREMQLLAEENQRLKQQLAEREAVLRMAQERSNATPAPDEPADQSMLPASVIDIDGAIINLELLKHWQLILAASILLLAFSVGGWLVDWRMRRRHGGFRI